MTRRSLSFYRENPRAFDRAVEDWNDRELARYEAMVDRAERTDQGAEVDEDYEAWLTSIEPEEDAPA